MVQMIPSTVRLRVALEVTQKQKFCFVNLIFLVNLHSAWRIVGND